MKKLIYTLLLLLVTFPAMAQSLFEQYERFLTEPRTYVCYRPDGKLKIDGKLNESSWKKAAPTAPFVDISGEGFPTPKYETTAKMLWDDEYLYVGAVLQEEDIKARLTQRDTIIYYDNDFEVFIDPDSDGHNYFEISGRKSLHARGGLYEADRTAQDKRHSRAETIERRPRQRHHNGRKKKRNDLCEAK